MSDEFKPLLLRVDLCDAKGCGARAFVVTIFASRSELTWCMHHYHERKRVLDALAVTVIDYRDELQAS